MNAEIFSALSQNIGQIRRMKKAHEDMGTDIAMLKLENSELRRKLSSLFLFAVFLYRTILNMHA